MQLKFRISIIISFTFLLTASCIKHKTKGCKNPIATNYNPDADKDNRCLCQFNGIDKNFQPDTPQVLNIVPVMQETEVWCWLAVGEMIFKHYSIPPVNTDYQCGIIAAIGYTLNGACDKCNINCGNCIVPGGDPSMVSFMISSYPKVASKIVYENEFNLRSTFVPFVISEDLIKTEINNHRPIIAGINPGSTFVLPGNSQHVCLIVGYNYDINSELTLVINDPFPYYTKGVDVYSNAGGINNGNLSYKITYTNFTNNLKWNTSWYEIMW